MHDSGKSPLKAFGGRAKAVEARQFQEVACLAPTAVTKNMEVMMSHLAHNRFWPECSCSWLLGYGVFDDAPTQWGEKLLSIDPECEIDHGLPGHADHVGDAP